MNNAIVAGSMQAISVASGKSLAESFMQCDAIVIVDTSGSMGSHDSRGGKTRYEVASEELRQLQNHLPGKIAVVAFSSDTQFCPSGIPTNFGGGTDLLKALRFVKVADVPDMKFILISDGEPDDEPDNCLTFARGFINKISTIYVGPERETGGRDFLEKLARVTGGETLQRDSAKELLGGIQYLLQP